jgi:hypothetical protein
MTPLVELRLRDGGLALFEGGADFFFQHEGVHAVD